MSNDIEFIDGFFAKAPHENAPEFVKAKSTSNVKNFLVGFLDARTNGLI